MKHFLRFSVASIFVAAVIWLVGGATQRVCAQAGVTLTFTNVSETIKLKEKIDKSTMTTNTTTNCTVIASVIIDNPGPSNAPAFYAELFTGETSTNLGSNGIIEIPAIRRESALKAGKSKTVKINLKFGSNQAGTYCVITDTNLNVLAYTEIPSAP